MLQSITSWFSSSPASAPASEKSCSADSCSPKSVSTYDPTDPKQNPLNPQGLKPCCACPQTKSARDDCFLKYGEEATEKCKDVVANHLACMRSLGFKI